MTPQSLLTAALSNPDVLWAILTADVKVAGPWEADEGAQWTRVRRHPERGVVCSVRCEPGLMPLAFVSGLARATPVRTKELAESWCDAQLRAAGWLLATVNTFERRMSRCEVPVRVGMVDCEEVSDG